MIFRFVALASILGTALGYATAAFIALGAPSPPAFTVPVYAGAMAIPWILTIFCINRKFARDYPESFFANAPLWTKVSAGLAIAVALVSPFGGYYTADPEIAARLAQMSHFVGPAAMWCLLLPVIYAVHRTPDPS